MEDNSVYTELARELMEEAGRMGQMFSPETRNSTRGEKAVIHALYAVDEALTPGTLARLTGVTSARVANILASLEEKGYVAREHSTEDRRRVKVTLTPEGREYGLACKEQHDREFSAFLAELGEKDARELVRIVRRTRTIMEDRRREGRAVCE